MSVQQICENIYTFAVVLPDNPLKWLNCYVIKSGAEGRNLLIDTGFKRRECLEPLLEGIKELGLMPENTDVFISHAHSDHAGNAGALEKLGFRIMMGKVDYDAMLSPYWDRRKKRVISEGMPSTVAEEVMDRNPAKNFVSDPFEPIFLYDGDLLEYGGYSLRCIVTPGHTPGHICLYDETKKLIFLGDHVLFDISPNINSREEGSDTLGDYLSSLQRISELEIELALPAHRTSGNVSTRERIKQLTDHHRRRLEELCGFISTQPGQTAYDLAGQMRWKIRARNWQEFPAAQKWFAMGEALAHLDRLLKENIIEKKKDSEGIYRYYKKDTCSNPD